MSTAIEKELSEGKNKENDIDRLKEYYEKKMKALEERVDTLSSENKFLNDLTDDQRQEIMRMYEKLGGDGLPQDSKTGDKKLGRELQTVVDDHENQLKSAKEDFER